MEKIGFRPREAYQEFRSRILKHEIGFRGQSAKYLERSLSNGFDKPRNFMVYGFNKSWETIREERKRYGSLFKTFPLSYGRTNEPEIDRETVGELLNYYKEYPEKYCSVLLLNFKGIRGWWYTSSLLIHTTYPWSKRKLPSQVIAGAISLSSDDFQEIYDKLSIKEGNLDQSIWGSKSGDRMRRLLDRKMIRKALSAILELNETKGIARIREKS